MPHVRTLRHAHIVRISLCFAAIAVMLATASCGLANRDRQEEPDRPSITDAPTSTIVTPAPSQAATPTPTPSVDDQLLETIRRMDLTAKVGQLVMVGLDGTFLNESALRMIQEDKVGGFILFRSNIKSAEQTNTLLNELKTANGENAVPLWLGVDQEGGRVSRLPSELRQTPSARQVASANDPAFTREISEAIGTELKALGFNMNFAPVLDINSNPRNPVIGDRAFGDNPKDVIAHGLASMNGLSEGGVAAVVKHFPGHGDTAVDSHLDLPLIDKSLEELESFELLPFREAIRQGADAVMVGHLLMRQLDDERPASLSPAVIRELLRDRLQYDGVVMTDDMTMGALRKGYGMGEAAVQSVLAGADLLLVCHEERLQLEVLQALEQAAEQGILTEQRIDESLLRLLRLKYQYALSDEPSPPVDPEALNERMDSVMDDHPSSISR
ncbi:beta-N-acetylhexosaminidase [Paenibacillus sp. PL2-23]|uniref:beta-N-acetylhexosaminidase n=1 Tax=Paenibacillus sp. PL2-23 TaxID=2100729 RepID=UPI0030F52F76